MKKLTKILGVLTLLFSLFMSLGFRATEMVEAAPGDATVTLHKMKMTSFPDDYIQNTGQEMPGFGGYQYYTEGVEFKVYDVTAEFYAHRAGNNSVDASIAHVQGLTPSTTPVATVTTDDDGKVSFTLSETSGEKHAVYLFVETEKAGVTKAANMVLSFPVYALDENGEYTNTKLDHIHLYPKNEVDADGSLLVRKEGTANNEAINGAKFIVQDTTTERFLSGFADGLFTWTTDEALAFEFVTGNVYLGAGAEITSSPGTDGHLEITGFEPGSYLLIETEAPANVAIIDAEQETPFTITAGQQSSTELTVKNDTIRVDKDVVGDTRDYDIGDLIPYRIALNIPRGIGDMINETTYKHGQLIIKDAPEQGLQFYNPTDATDANRLMVRDGSGNDITLEADWLVAVDNGFELSIPASALTDYAGKELIVTYHMFLDEHAAPDTDYNNLATVSTVKLTDNDEGPEVYTGGRKFFKRDQNFDTNNALAGAKFIVKRTSDNLYLHVGADNAVTWVAEGDATKLESGTDGIVEVFGLATGHYELIETDAPEDYVLNGTLIPFEIAKGTYGATPIEVMNIRKGRLPSTGGSGIIGILGLGAVLVTTTGGYYIKRRKDA